MKGATAIRFGWGVFALPLAVVSVIAILATWPAVFDNSPTRLLCVAYIVILPIVPALWSATKRGILVLAASATLATQIATFGILNLWF
jgi:hypothetical protein